MTGTAQGHQVGIVLAIVGEDPGEFAETFVQAYSGRQGIDRECAVLIKAMDDAERRGQK